MCFWLVWWWEQHWSWGNGLLFGLILEKAFLFPWHGMQEMSHRVARWAAPLFYCGACTESGWIRTQLLGFERIGSTLLFVQVLASSSLISPSISVFSAPALLPGNKYSLAFSYPLTNSYTTFHALRGSVSGICPLGVFFNCFFPFESLNLLGNRYMEIYSVGIQMICHHLMPKSVQRVA